MNMKHIVMPLTITMVIISSCLYMLGIYIISDAPESILGYANILVALFSTSLTFSMYNIEKEWMNGEGADE